MRRPEPSSLWLRLPSRHDVRRGSWNLKSLCLVPVHSPARVGQTIKNSAIVLNWVIGAYLATYVFGYSEIVAARPACRVVFVIVPICLLAWQAMILRNRFVQPEDDPAVPFYERVD